MIQMSFRQKVFRPEWRNLLIITALLMLTGCKYPFELDQQDARPMAVIRSYLCADSLVTIDIRKTIPLSQLATADTTLNNPRFSLKCNGTDVDAAESVMGGTMILRTDAFKSGDKIEVVFESDDMETAVARTVIPHPFPEYSLELTRSSYAERNLKISYKDDPDTDDWYGAIVKWNGIQETYVGLDELQYYEVCDQDIVPPTGYNDIQLEPETYSPIVISFNDYHNYLYIWKDTDEEDNVYDLHFNYKAQWVGNITGVKETEVQCTLFKLSEEMYMHMFAEFDYMNNPFMGAGLSSPAFTYTNVMNGTGYLCGYSAVKSEWIKDNLFEE